MNEDHSSGIHGVSNMKLSDDALVLLSLLDTNAFSKRIGVIHWSDVIESLTALHAISHRSDTTGKDVANYVQQLSQSMPDEIFFELIGRDEEPLVVKTILPSGEKLTKRFSEDWSDFCSSPNSMNDAEYPPHSWPVWCNGKETVFVTEDCKVCVEKHQ